MSTSIADLAINLTANIAGFENDLGKAYRAAAKFSKGTITSIAGVTAAFTAMGTFVAAGVKQSIDRMDEMQAAAKRVGLSSSALSALGYAAEQANVPMAALEASMSKLAKTAGAAMAGPGRERNVFEQLGISVQELRDLKPDELLVRIAEKFVQFKDGTAKSALAMEVFGRGARAIMPLLVEGGDGVTDMMEKARDLGLVLDDKTTAAADRFNDSLNDLRGLQQGFFNDIARQALPMLSSLADKLVEQGIAARKAGEDTNSFAKVLEYLLRFGIGVKTVFEIAGKAIGAVGATAVEVGAAVWDYLKGFGQAFKEAATSPLEFFANMEETHEKAESLSATIAARMSGIWSGFADDFAKDMQESAAQIAALNVGTTEAGKAAEVAGRNFGNLDTPIIAAADATKDLNEAMKEWKKLQSQHDKEMLAAERAAKELRDAQAELTDGFVTLLASYATEAELLRMSESERAKALPLLEAEAAVRDLIARATERGVKVAPEEQAMMQQRARDAAHLNTVLADSAAISEEWQSNWEGAVDAVGDAFADFIADGLSDWDDFGKQLLDIAKQYISNLIRLFLQQRLPALQQGGISGGGSIAQGLYGSPNSLFGGQGFSWGGAFAAGAYGYTAYQQAQQGNAGGAAISGAMTGAQIGTMIMPGIGTAVGAIIGALAGYFMTNTDVPGLNVIGDDVVGTSGYRNLAPGSSYESNLGGFTFASIDNVDRATRDQMAGEVVKFDNLIASMVDTEQLDRIKAALADWNLRLEEGAISAENILGSRFEAILGTFDEDIQEMVRGAGDLQAQVQKLGEVLQWPKAIEGILEAFGREDMLAGMTDLERQTFLVNEEFDNAREALEMMGASEEQIAQLEEYRTNALERLGNAQEEVLRNEQGIADLMEGIRWDDYLDGLEGIDRTIAQINHETEEWIRRLTEMGASEEELAEAREIGSRRVMRAIEEDNRQFLQGLLDLERQVIDRERDLNQQYNEAFRAIGDFLRGQPFGTSSASPEERLGIARSELTNLARLAATGDLAALQSLTSAGQQFLNASAGYFGVGSSDFTRDEAFLRALLAPFAGVGGDTLADTMSELTAVLGQLLAFLNRQGVNDPVTSALNRIELAVKSGNESLTRAVDKASARGARVL